RAGREQVFECAEGTFMLRRGREDFPVDFDRSEDVAELLLLQLAQAILEAQDLVGGVAEVRLRNQDLGEFLVLARLLIESIESLKRRAVLRLVAENLLVGLDGARDIVGSALEEGRSAQRDGRAEVGLIF